MPGAILDLASLSFQLPISGSVAKPSATAETQSASVNPTVFVLMCPIEAGFPVGAKICFETKNVVKALSYVFPVTFFEFALNPWQVKIVLSWREECGRGQGSRAG